MTVDTPFPQRLPTPFWSPRGPMGMQGIGDDVTSITTAALNDATAAYVATQQPSCPIGYVAYGSTCQLASAVTGSVSASGNPGMLILIAIGAYLLMKGNR